LWNAFGALAEKNLARAIRPARKSSSACIPSSIPSSLAAFLSHGSWSRQGFPRKPPHRRGEFNHLSKPRFWSLIQVPCKGGADSFRRGQQPIFHCEVRSPAPDYHGRIAELVRLSKVKVDLSLLTIESIPALF
jgi:hypothetical protein